MKKKILSLAVATGLVGAASVQAAMHINDQGHGEALVYPFYSAANGNDTYVHVVNTTEYTKAVKVRFIEAMNSQEVLDFNLYLSPEDVWAGVITANPNGTGAIIRTADTSCTVPELGIERTDVTNALVNQLGITRGDIDGVQHNGLRDQPFVSFKYAAPEGRDADSVRGIERTTEGYIEIIEMGQLDPNGDQLPTTTGAPGVTYNLSEAATHNAEGVPNDCGLLRNTWAQSPRGTWLDNSGYQLLDWDEGAPGVDGRVAGGLYGYGLVINVNDGSAYGYDAVAIDDFRSAGTDAGGLHARPGSENPSLSNAEPAATIFDGEEAVTYSFDTGVDAVSALFMSTDIMNDYVADPGRNAKTDWVVTMPTKRFYVQGTSLVGGAADRPFWNNWDPENSRACETISFNVLDREEAFVPDAEIGSGFSPEPPQAAQPSYSLCTEVSIISFGDESALYASERINHGFSSHYDEGWAEVNFESAGRWIQADALVGGGLEPVQFGGLPVIGFAAQKVQNGTLQGGILANYGAAVKHKSERTIVPQ